MEVEKKLAGVLSVVSAKLEEEERTHLCIEKILVGKQKKARPFIDGIFLGLEFS